MSHRFGLGFAAAIAAFATSPLMAQTMNAPADAVVILSRDQIDIPAPQVRAADEEHSPVEAPARENLAVYQQRRYRTLVGDELETFGSDGELRKFLRDLQRLERGDRRRFGSVDDGKSGKREFVVAFLQDEVPECAVPEDCPEDEAGSIVVTGSRIASSSISAVMPVNVTNTQVAAVDEGDIVKLIGDYLLVLQDGRVFAVHYPTMRLTDRVDVYRKDADGDPIGADWYDEMLVQGDQVIITAYSYSDQASEITVLRLDQASGKIENRGVFLITSDDYYDLDNYATRIVGDRLVIYTPYEAEQIVSRNGRPTIRKWQPDEVFDEGKVRGRQLLRAQDIYRPLFGVAEPWIHTVSICPLGNVAKAGLDCRSTAFMGSEPAEMYVAADAVYLWTSALSYDDREWNDCTAATPRAPFGMVAPGAVFRVPISGAEPGVLGVRGMPFDQFGMDATGGRFRALAGWNTIACVRNDDRQDVALLDVSAGKFRDRYTAATTGDFTALPSVPFGKVENRFTPDWLVYGSRDRWSRYPPRDEEALLAARQTRVQVIPLDEPELARPIAIGHSLIRLERIGFTAFVANGYADDKGLRVSYLGLDDQPDVTTSAFLPGRYESESRSHAFNATFDATGRGMLGVPTVTRGERSGGWWWYSDVSDLSFLGFDATGVLSDAGQIQATPEDEVRTADGYDCEVSCIDWYGNARPIFLAGKVFGLMATELVEAEVVGGKVAERRRVDLTGTVQR